MEAIFDECREIIDDLGSALDRYADILPKLQELREYYESPLWLEDVADDEQGAFGDMKRGVLSEDGIWNMLDEEKSLRDMMEELCRNR